MSGISANMVPLETIGISTNIILQVPKTCLATASIVFTEDISHIPRSGTNLYSNKQVTMTESKELLAKDRRQKLLGKKGRW